MTHYKMKKFVTFINEGRVVTFDKKRNGNFVMLMGGPGSGKCLKNGTKIIMYDGSLKNVEDIEVGDILMGPDSTPRNVLSTSKGTGDLYKVEQNKGEDYVINDNHILSLKKSIRAIKDGRYKNEPDTVNIHVKEYLEKSNRWKHNFYGYKTIIDFDKKEVDIEPYFLGIWLGDGTQVTTQITTEDTIIEKYLIEYADRLDLNISYQIKEDNKAKGVKIISNNNNKNNTLLKLLDRYNLRKEKHIPDNYLFNNMKNRLELLAGLIDSDGFVDKGGYGIVQKNKNLILQIKLLCDQLGFKTNLMDKYNKKYNKMYYMLSINGDIDKIPVKLDRKKIYPKRRVNHLVTGINVEYYGKGDYSGFELDNDNLFLLEDCTVLHNSFISKNLMDLDNVRFFNVDDEREMMARKLGLDLSKPEDNEEVLKYTHGSSNPKNRTINLLKTLLKSEKKELPNIVFDTVGNHIDMLKDIIGLARENGYDLTLVHVKTDLEIALQRNRERARRLGDDVVIFYHNMVQESYNVLIPLFDHAWIVYNNDIHDFENRRDITTKVK